MGLTHCMGLPPLCSSLPISSLDLGPHPSREGRGHFPGCYLDCMARVKAVVVDIVDGWWCGRESSRSCSVWWQTSLGGLALGGGGQLDGMNEGMKCSSWFIFITHYMGLPHPGFPPCASLSPIPSSSELEPPTSLWKGEGQMQQVRISE